MHTYFKKFHTIKSRVKIISFKCPACLAILCWVTSSRLNNLINQWLNSPSGSRSTEFKLESSLWSCKTGRGAAARDVTSGLDSPEPPSDRTNTALLEEDAMEERDRPLCGHEEKKVMSKHL